MERERERRKNKERNRAKPVLSSLKRIKSTLKMFKKKETNLKI